MYYTFNDVVLDTKGFYYVRIKVSTELNNYEDILGKAFYTYIDDLRNPCIFVDLNVNNAKRKYTLGESVGIKERVMIRDEIEYYSDECHDGGAWGISAPYFYSPNYIGVGKLSWIINGTTLETKDYTTVAKYSDIVPGVYYEPMDYQEFSLSNPGLNTIMLQVFGGDYSAWTRTGSILLPRTDWPYFQFEVDLKSPTNKSLYFIVADCDGSAVITNINDPLLSPKESMQKEIGKGTIEIQNVKFDDGRDYEVEAYKNIILKPGTVIKAGTSFRAKINPAPCSSSNSNPLKSSINFTSNKEFEDKTTAENNRTINVNEKVRIYPNVTSGIVNVIISDNTIINNLKIYDMSGRLLYNNGNFGRSSILDLSYLNEGVYILKIQSSLGITTHRVVIKK
ncbi:MAG: T9SS type A sorting domain-containing protein [Candidatus Azobacteroides sp.]|nr:T9SS type A sorting domain-containing protein [Candidatus Azobacteroides sp.]